MTWHCAQGRPVWDAKLGTAEATRGSPTNTLTSAKTKIEIAALARPLRLQRVDCNTIPEPSLIHGTFRFRT
jgi:hypothetical protein